MNGAVDIHTIQSSRSDSYHDNVVDTYDDPPEFWHKALGHTLMFQFGLFDSAELAEGPKPGPVGPSELLAFETQLQLAGLLSPDRPKIK